MGHAAVATEYMTVEEYLRMERDSETKHEYVRGKVVDMAGGSLAHNQICQNLSTTIGSFLKGKRCRSHSSDQRVFVEESNTYYYPDLTIACPPFQVNMDNPPALLNPKLIIEVLSSSTASYDLVDKRKQYQLIPDLEEILYIDSTRVLGHLWRRNENGWSEAGTYTEAAEMVELKSLGFQFPLSEAYDELLENGTLKSF